MAKTQKELFTEILSYVEGNEELTNFVNGRLEALAKKSSKNSKASQETAVRAEKLYTALAEMDKPVTFAQLKELTADEEIKGWTPQRLTALVRHLGDRVVKTVEKGKPYYTVA